MRRGNDDVDEWGRDGRMLHFPNSEEYRRYPLPSSFYTLTAEYFNLIYKQLGRYNKSLKSFPINDVSLLLSCICIPEHQREELQIELFYIRDWEYLPRRIRSRKFRHKLSRRPRYKKCSRNKPTSRGFYYREFFLPGFFIPALGTNIRTFRENKTITLKFLLHD